VQTQKEEQEKCKQQVTEDFGLQNYVVPYVDYVQTQKEEQEKCKQQVTEDFGLQNYVVPYVEYARVQNLDCSVPELVRCAGRGDLAGVRQLLDSGMDTNIQDDLGLTALHCAAKKGHEE
ncbi:unnamed protein product, partial [Polarella glacialis]